MWSDQKGYVGFKRRNKSEDRAVLILSKFPIGGHALHPEHTKYLDQFVVPVLVNEGSATISALTSRSGSDKRNIKVSENRAVAVADYLTRRCGGGAGNILQIKANGEAYAKAQGLKDGEESPWFRSVVITYWDNPVPPVIDPTLPNLGPVDVAPPDISVPGAVSLAVDVVGGLEMIVSVGFGVGTSAAVTAGGFALTILGPSISGIATLMDAEANVEFNGFCEGFADCQVAMAEQFSSESLRTKPMSKWPALLKPKITRPGQVIVGRWADVAAKGYTKGVNDAFATVALLDQLPVKKEVVMQGKKKQVDISSRVYLRVLWLKHRRKIREAVIKRINSELFRRSEAPYMRS